MKNKIEDSIQMFLDSDTSAIQVAMSKSELEEMGMKTPGLPETTGVLISFQYIGLDLDEEETGLKLQENRN